jgi:CRP-like cAMP-binding protein
MSKCSVNDGTDRQFKGAVVDSRRRSANAADVTDARLLQRLSSDPWFASLAPADCAALVDGSDALHFRPGEYVFRQGDAPSGFYGVAAGSLKVSSLREDGKEAILTVLDAGRWFGELSSIDGLPRTHDVTALESATVRRVKPAVFDRLMRSHAFAHAIAVLQAAHARAVFAMLEDVALRSLRARVARRLLWMANGLPGDGEARLHLAITQDRLAMMLGITRQTLAQELRAIASEGAVAPGYGRIEIVSVEKLRAIGGVTP